MVPKRARRRVGPPRRVTQSSNRVADPTGQDQRARERRQRRGQGARVGRRGPAESDVESDGDRPRRLGPKQRLRDAGPGPGGDAGEKARACPLGERREQAERGVGSCDEEVDRGVVGALSVEFFFFFLKEFLSKRRKKKSFPRIKLIFFKYLEAVSRGLGPVGDVVGGRGGEQGDEGEAVSGLGWLGFGGGRLREGASSSQATTAFCRWPLASGRSKHHRPVKRHSIFLTCKSASPIRPAPRFGRPTRPSMRRPLPPRTPRRGGGARGVSASVPPSSMIPPSCWRSTLSASPSKSNASRSRRRSWRPSTWAWTPPPTASRSLRLEVGRLPSRGETLGAASLIEGRSDEQQSFLCEQHEIF